MAVYGLRCWDSSGNITVDITDRISRTLGRFTVTFTTGTREVVIPNVFVNVASPFKYFINVTAANNNPNSAATIAPRYFTHVRGTDLVFTLHADSKTYDSVLYVIVGVY